MDYKSEYENLRQQLDNQRREESRQAEEDYQRREDARRQRIREYQEAQCYAETWDEAFRKTLPRLRKEAGEERQMNEEIDGTEAAHYMDTYFQEQVEQHEFAQGVWLDENKAVQARIKRIRERAAQLIERIEQQARNKAAARVDEKFGKETHIGENLRNNDIDSVVNW